jgi:glycosyltransferase involved in cell wall biosynthesis
VAFEPRNRAIHRLKYSTTCHGIIAVSVAVREAMLQAGVPANKIEVIPNGVEFPAGIASEEQRAAARAKFGFTDDHFVVGHLGAFAQEKGQDVAIAAVALLKERMPQLRMILAGENPPSAPPDRRVQLPGFIENRDEFFAALDLFIMPSRSEGWGLAAAEAMAHGLPVVASETGGLRDVVVPGETGWLVTPGDPRLLAEAIARAACDPLKLREMGAQARERSRRFSSSRTAELTEAFYRRLLVPS